LSRQKNVELTFSTPNKGNPLDASALGNAIAPELHEFSVLWRYLDTIPETSSEESKA